MKVLRIFTALLLIFLLLNYFSRKLLPFAYSDVADYDLLYTTSDNIYVKKIGIVNDSIDILFGGAVKEVNQYTVSWRFSREEYGPDTGIVNYTGKTLRYKPPSSKPQVITATINNGSGPFLMNVSYTPLEVYRKAGNASSLSFEVTSADIAIEPGVVRDVNDWVPRVWVKDERMAISQVRQYLIDSAGITDNESTVQKILKIGRFVLGRMPADRGLPSEETSALHPIRLLEEAKAGRANLWCGNYTAIFGCLASAAGIPYRTIDIGGSKGNLGLGNHSFCEAWIKEEKCWAYVDLTNNTILVQLGDRFLNAIDLQRLLRYPGGTDQVNCYSIAGDSIGIVPYNSKLSNARYYFNSNTFFTFYYRDYFSTYSKAGYWQRIKNLFFTRPVHAVYSDKLNSRNYHFLIRIISNYLLIATVLAWLLLVLLKLTRLLKKRASHG